MDIEPAESDTWYLGLKEKVYANPTLYPQFIKVQNNYLLKYCPTKSAYLANEKEWKFVVPKSQKFDIIKDSHNPPQ